jgi:hypothetical protein
MTEPAEISIRTEPKGDAYRVLVDTLVGHAAQFLLVVRDQLDLSPAGRQTLDALEPFKQRLERKSEWPGTELIGHFAEVGYYKCSPGSASVLKRSSPGLYAWQQPHLPEDLCFLDQNGEVLLASVAHEADGWVRSGPVAQAIRSALGDGYVAADEVDA